jgi:hypothetical protein
MVPPQNIIIFAHKTPKKNEINKSTFLINYQNTMVPKLLIVFFALAISTIDAKRCNSCCESCSPHIRRADKLQNELTKIKSSRLNIGVNFELSVSTIDGKHIGYIQDVYEPIMTIPPNSQIYISSRIPKFSEFEFVRIFYDVNHKGLFNDLPIPGNYTARQISLPYRSVSSIIIPSGYQAIFYDCDHFSGNFIVMSTSQKDFGKFNDKMVSMEIMKIYEETPEHVAIIHSHPNYNGKKIGMEIGETLEIESSKIGSIMIRPEHEFFVYEKSILIDVISKSIPTISTSYRPFLATVIAQKSSSEYAIFYDEVDYKGDHFTLLYSNPAHKDRLNEKLSSMSIPMNHEVVLYENENMQGAHIILSGNIPNLVFYLFNDRAQKIVYQERSEKPIQNVVIYTKPNFTGETRTIPIGYSKIQEVIYAGSIKVPDGYTVILKKLPIFPFNYERKSVYSADSSNTIDYFDTPLISVFVDIV